MTDTFYRSQVHAHVVAARTSEEQMGSSVLSGANTMHTQLSYILWLRRVES
jgi:hypothetical protein